MVKLADKEHTTIKEEGGVTTVRLYKTDIVVFSDNIISLDSGGHLTKTTKMRMNQASEEFGLGFRVVQKHHRWVVWRDGQTLDFHDGMTFDRT